MFGDLSFSHILILLLVLVLVFGAKRIPEIGSSLGQGIKEFKRSLKDATGDEPAPPRTAPPASRSSSLPSAPPPAARALRPKDLLAPVHDLRLRAQRRHIRLHARLARLIEDRLALRVALLEPSRRVGRNARQRLHQEVARLAREQPARLARPEPKRRAEHQGLPAQVGGRLHPRERAELLHR